MKLRILWVRAVLEYLGGAREEPPERFPLLPASRWWGLVWGILVCLIVIFCGQTSKFIYLDF